MTRLVEIPPEQVPGVGGRSLFRHEGKSVALFNLDGTLYAIDDSCPHQGASLFGGKLDGRLLQCPAHGLRFDLATGCMPNLKGFGVATYTVEQRGEACFIDLSDSKLQEPSA